MSLVSETVKASLGSLKVQSVTQELGGILCHIVH